MEIVEIGGGETKKQRTEKWRKDRMGRWTGSQLQAIMTCQRGASKYDWDDMNRILSFGETALKYIYENAMERKTGRYLELGEGTQEMRYGTKVEPLILKYTKEQLKKYGKVREVGFKIIEQVQSAGVSSDSILFKKSNAIATIESKACTNWGTHFERTFEKTNEKSKDFWQMQGQMLAWNVKKCYYITAEPPAKIADYLYYPNDIMEMYEHFIKEVGIKIERVRCSPKHMQALLRRINICEQVLNDWLAEGGNIRDILNDNLKHFEENPELLDKFLAPLPFQKDKVQLTVSWPAWAITESSYAFLTKKGKSSGSWSGKKWFPKSKTRIVQKFDTSATIEIPKWLHKKLKL